MDGWGSMQPPTVGSSRTAPPALLGALGGDETHTPARPYIDATSGSQRHQPLLPSGLSMQKKDEEAHEISFDDADILQGLLKDIDDATAAATPTAKARPAAPPTPVVGGMTDSSHEGVIRRDQPTGAPQDARQAPNPKQGVHHPAKSVVPQQFEIPPPLPAAGRVRHVPQGSEIPHVTPTGPEGMWKPTPATQVLPKLEVVKVTSCATERGKNISEDARLDDADKVRINIVTNPLSNSEYVALLHSLMSTHPKFGEFVEKKILFQQNLVEQKRFLHEAKVLYGAEVIGGGGLVDTRKPRAPKVPVLATKVTAPCKEEVDEIWKLLCLAEKARASRPLSESEVDRLLRTGRKEYSLQ